MGEAFATPERTFGAVGPTIIVLTETWTAEVPGVALGHA